MATNKKINVTELDFDAIKSNIKEFLSGQEEFQDYDFEGSGMSVLMDTLAYNTHYNALYNNMAINEMFLDSARKRSSVVSLAKQLGYTPRSAKCATATVNIVVSGGNSSPTNLTIPSFSQFNTTVDGQSLTFFNRGSITTNRNGNTYTFTGVELIEGTPLTNKFLVASGTRYIIPNADIDMDTLKVKVQENSTSSFYETYSKADSLVTATPDSKLYWIKEIDNSLYEMTFGDGNLGKSLSNGNVVHIDYFVSSKDLANGARTFTYNGETLLSGATITITTTSPASNGSDREEIDSIRFNAPKMYSSQNRAVTPDDYKALIYANVPEAKSVAVWGGEDNNPPVYGKTFICVKPKNASKLTSVQKASIISSILAQRNVVSVTPEILDPEYINIALDITVYYNDQETTKTASEIETIVTNTLFKYDDDDLQRFDGMFRFSKLSKLIDESDPSIVSNITTVLLRRRLIPRYNVSAQYILNIINPIFADGQGTSGSFTTTGFYIAGSDEVHYMNDDGVGYVRLFKYGPNAIKQYVNNRIGTIDYANGIVDIRNLHITALADIDFEISIKPQSNDVVSALTQIAEIARDHLTVTAIADKAATGDLRGGYNYVFSSSRS
jgi:hypothetical protein